MGVKVADESGLLIDGPESRITLVLAHGAGAPMDHPFMNVVAEGVAKAGIRVVRFEFPYMAQRRLSGKRPGPNSAAVLMQTWRDVIKQLGDPDHLVIGGKSMGGRIASMVADDAEVRGLVCLGYPFHPAGKPERLRTEHLQGLSTTALIVQGERDALGNRAEVAGYDLSPSITVHWMTDGDHSFKPRKSSGRTEADNLEEAVAASVAFVQALD
jgi:predicted alpha/beta-hydrolase family hydrolase